MAVPTDAKLAAPVLSSEQISPASALSLKRRAAFMEAFEDILYGSAAGIAGKYIEYPFDTVKVRLQSQPDHLPLRYRGPLDCFRQSLRADGFRGLYRGISAPLVGAALETSGLFSFERLGRETLVWMNMARRDEQLSLLALYYTGAFSGVFTSFILTPIELVKCKIQVAAGGSGQPAGASPAAATPTKHRRPLAVIREIYHHEGLRGFWHGQMGTLIREAGGSAAWFGSKETTTSLLRDWNVYAFEQKKPTSALSSAAYEAELDKLRTAPLPLWQQAVAGASAGMAYNFLFFPADTVKSRMQTAPVGGRGPGGAGGAKRSFMDEARALWKQTGIKGFYRGCGMTVARAAPSSAFIFMVYDGMKTHLPLA